MDTQNAVSPRILPLSQLHSGEEATIAHVESGKFLLKKMIALGLIDGVKVTVLQCEPGQGLVIGVDNRKIAIGFGMAQKIYVSLIKKRV